MSGRWRFVALLSAALMGGPSEARPIHYGAVDNAALGTCDAARWRGESESAEPCYEALLAGGEPPHIRAEAAWALGDLHAANRLYRTANAAMPDDADVLTRWGDLYAHTHNDAEAMAIYREALALDDQHPFALLGAATVLAGSFDDAANAYLEPLLVNATLDAGARAAAWLLIARIALENGDTGEAVAHLEEAARLIEENGWPPLELYALRAAFDLLENNPQSPWTEKALALNPEWGEIYATPAYFYVITRRYRQAIDLYQKAVDVEPRLASAHEQMGVNLLRDNQMQRARRHLETAHDLDPFSPVAVNTLRLLDSLNRFDVIQDPESPSAEGEIPIVLRLHEEESAAIAPYAIELTRQSIEEFSKRYEFELREPVVIELYPDHEDFAVRTAGMPGIGILGATFGYVVAMDSPSARSPDNFQWGTTLWHELAHVFTLEASNHLVPRWFSEGVSVWEEWRSGPTPGVRVPIGVYTAMQEDRFLPVAILDQGFMRPSYENQVIVSYMQAGLICQFINQRFGEDKLAGMLRAFAAGADTVEAIRDVLGLSTPAFDREFEAFLDREHGPVLASLDSWHELQTEAAGAAAAEDWETLIESAEALIELQPGYAEPDSPYVMLAAAYRETGDAEAETAALAAFFANGGFAPQPLKRYAGLLRERGDTDRAIDVLHTIVMVQPLDVEVHETLGELLLARGDAALALREFEIVVARDALDKANAYYQMARAHRALGDADATRSNLLLALDVAPGFRDAQRLLLEVMRGNP